MRLQYQINKYIGEITLSNPPYNVLTVPDFEEYSVLKHFLNEGQLKAVIVKGDGRNFCAGADLDKLNSQIQNENEFRASLNRGKELLKLLTYANIPIIAMINGSCLGAGLEIALSCHFRICSENAMLGFPESNYGMIPGFGGTVLSSSFVQLQNIVSLIISGRIINGDEASKMGICSYSSSKKELRDNTINFIEQLIQNRSSKVIRMAMTSINNGRQLELGDALKEETNLFLKCIT